MWRAIGIIMILVNIVLIVFGIASFVRLKPVTGDEIAIVLLIASYVGVIVTFGVGFQIYGMININEKSKELEI